MEKQNTQDIFADFVKGIKGSDSTLHENVDIMWNVPNALALSNEMLLFLQSISSTITFVEDYTTVAEKLDLTQEQAISIQKINADLILYQRLIIKYCSQQYLIQSMIKSLIDDVLLSAPEIKDIQSIDEITEYIKNFETTQTAGGQKGGCGKICLTLIMLYLILLATMPSETEAIFPDSWKGKKPKNSPEPTAVTTSQPGPGTIIYKDQKTGLTTYNTGMISLDTTTFYNSVKNKNLTKTNMENITAAVIKYSPSPLLLAKKKITDLMGLTDVNQNIIESVISELNNRSKKISQTNAETCIKIINDVYRYDGFNTLYDLNAAGDITNMVADVSKALKKQEEASWNDFKLNSLKKGTTGALVVGTLCVATGPVGWLGCSAAAAASAGLASLQEYIGYAEETNVAYKKADRQVTEIASSNPLNRLNEGQKLDLKTNIKEASKVYCSNAFNLNWNFNSTDNTIQVIGDHVSYENIVGLFSTIQQNLKYQITTKLSKNLDDPENKILSSLNQRLEILKSISASIYSLLSYEFNSNLERELRNLGPNTLNDIVSSYSKKIDELNRLSEQAMMFRPLDKERQVNLNKQLEEELKIQELEFEGNNMARNVRAIKIEDNRLDKLITANATKYAVEGYTNIGLSSLVGLGRGTLGSTGAFIGESLSAFFSKLIAEWNAAGIILGSVTVFALCAFVAGGQIKMFKDAVGTIWIIITSPVRAIVFVYKAVFSPVFGIILKPIGAIVNRGTGALTLPSAPSPAAASYPDNSASNLIRNPTNSNPSGTIKVNVRDPNNTNSYISYNVDPNSSARNLKEQIFTRQHFQVANQELKYKDVNAREWKTLNDNDTFTAKGITNNSNLLLNIVGVGGKRFSRKNKAKMYKNSSKKKRFRNKVNKKTKKKQKKSY